MRASAVVRDARTLEHTTTRAREGSEAHEGRPDVRRRIQREGACDGYRVMCESGTSRSGRADRG
jgi:hypothetical protein